MRSLFLAAVACVAVTLGVYAVPAQAAISIETEYTDIKSQGIIFANICSSADAACDCRDSGQCTVSDVLQVFVNLSFLILALSGTAALIALIYGGLEWIISAGYPERVKRGKQAITGAAIGLAIVFGAYTFINLVIGVLKATDNAADPIPTGPIEDTIGDGADDVITTE